MSKLPDFEGLALFAKVAEHQSYAGAARALELSVATVSRAVTRLEERLGGRLINRSSRRLALTDLGQRLAERAHRIYDEAEAAEQGARETSARPRGLVRLAVPMSFGLRSVAPLLPEFLRRYPQVSVDLHLSDAAIDLIGQGFDAALRIAVLEDSALVARLITPVRRFIVAAPRYLAQHGRPQRPDQLRTEHCLGYAYRAKRDVWRLTSRAGETATIVPNGPLRATNADALLPTVLDGQAIAELPEFIAADYVRDGRLEVILPDWSFSEGGLYFVTPTSRTRAAKVEALSDFLRQRLALPAWRLALA